MPIQTRDLVLVSLFGAIVGLAFYLLIDVVPDLLDDTRLWLCLSVFAACLFGGALAMVGPISLQRTFVPSGVMALGVTALIIWASFRFEDGESFMETGHPFAVIATLFVILVPFLMTYAGKTTSPKSYPDLFDAAWGSVTRVVVALAFTGVFWGLLFFSNALLELVGITVIEDLIDIEAVPAILTGAVFGLAMGVVYELATLISPQLILRLLRLLMPMITVVVVIFVMALPFRGLSNLFGALSAGMVMMGMGLVAISLVSAAIDRTAQDGVQRVWMRAFVQVLVLLVPILGGLAIAAVWLRVQDYGWTPDRLVAATLAGIVFIYGVAYAVCVVLRGDWGGRLRRYNVGLSLGVVAILAVWMTPVLNPQAISTASQLARLEKDVALDKLPLFDFARTWGKAGKAGLAQLEARFEADGDKDALALIAKAKDVSSRYQFEAAAAGPTPNQQAMALDAAMIVYPAGSLRPSEFFNQTQYAHRAVYNTCLDGEEGTSSGCVLIQVTGETSEAGHVVVVTNLDKDSSVIHIFNQDGIAPSGLGRKTLKLSDATKDALRNGSYRVAPPSWQSLWVGDQEFFQAPWTVPQ